MTFKSKKARTIAACAELAAKYRNPDGKTFFLVLNCPLCIIHNTVHVENPMLSKGTRTCVGCPLASKTGEVGCTRFDSYDNAHQDYIRNMDRCEGEDYDSIDMDTPIVCGYKGEPSIHFLRRAMFFDHLIPILSELPPERFTRAGWVFLDLLVSG